MPKLNFGCSFDIREGWTNSDRDDHGQEHVGDLLAGLPFADDYFDCIVANHSIQMIRFDDLQRALAELRRVLKPGGTLRLLVPDAGIAIARWLDQKHWTAKIYPEAFPISEDIEQTLDGRFLRYLFWHGDARSGFTAESLADALKRAGFSKTSVCGYQESSSDVEGITELDSRQDESLIMEAVK